MEFHCIWIIGIFIVLGVAPPYQPLVNEDNQDKTAPVVVKCIIFKFDGNIFPYPLFSLALRNLLSSIKGQLKRLEVAVVDPCWQCKLSTSYDATPRNTGTPTRRQGGIGLTC
ncbi:hypothetical protein V2J09_010713 [Rumex salicifolius]